MPRRGSLGSVSPRGGAHPGAGGDEPRAFGPPILAWSPGYPRVGTYRWPDERAGDPLRPRDPRLTT